MSSAALIARVTCNVTRAVTNVKRGPVQKAQEAQAQLNHYLLAAQAIRTSIAPQTATYNTSHPPQGVTPKASTTLATDAESWHLRQSESQTQSALAISYASTQATSTSTVLQVLFLPFFLFFSYALTHPAPCPCLPCCRYRAAGTP